MKDKEEHAIVLDYLPYGYPLEKKMMPIAQAVGKKNFTLLELVPRRGIKLEQGEEVYIGEGKRDKVYYILGKLQFSKITESARTFLENYIQKQIDADEKRFVDFFNKAEPINTRLHQLELLPGFGKKHTQAILDERNKKPFESKLVGRGGGENFEPFRDGRVGRPFQIIGLFGCFSGKLHSENNSGTPLEERLRPEFSFNHPELEADRLGPFPIKKNKPKRRG